MARVSGRSRQQPTDYQVFVSHATKDKWIAIQLDKMIQERGIATFRDDRDMEGGAKVPEVIREQLRRSKELVVLWSPQALNSEWVKLEVAMAFAYRLHIVPVRYLTEVSTLLPIIRDVQSPELTEVDVTKYLEDLTARSRAFGRN